MLLHLSPRVYWPYKNAAIVDLEIETLGLHLVGGVDLITRRPFPNKRLKVACRKRGHNKAFNGILIETSGPVDEFDMVARWAIEAQTVVTHHVHYRLLDHDFDAASDDYVLLYPCSRELGGWSDRRPVSEPRQSPPSMEVLPREYGEGEKPVTYQDSLDGASGWIMKRSQSYAMPTIERGRIVAGLLGQRLPPLDSAFFVAVRG